MKVRAGISEVHPAYLFSNLCTLVSPKTKNPWLSSPVVNMVSWLSHRICHTKDKGTGLQTHWFTQAVPQISRACGGGGQNNNKNWIAPS